MRLQAAANFANKTPCLDAYSGELLFHGQFSLYDDTKRDSEAAERRVLSVDPDATLPDRYVVEAAGSRWIIGHSNPDTFKGRVIRMGYVAHEATALSTIRTLDEFCTNAVGAQAYAGRAWIKNLGFSEQSSNLASQYHIHYARNESVGEGDVLTFDGEHHVVRSTVRGAAGTLICLSEHMEEPVVETGSISATSWDPVTETWSGASANVRMIRMRWQSLFQYRSNQAPSFGPEDIQLAVSKSLLTPAPGMRVTLSDGAWQIASVLDEGVWLCRAVRHA